MFLIKIEHELDKDGNRIDSLENTYADFYAADISKQVLYCPNNHPVGRRPLITLSIDAKKIVVVSGIKDCCCVDYRNSIVELLRKMSSISVSHL